MSSVTQTQSSTLASTTYIAAASSTRSFSWTEATLDEKEACCDLPARCDRYGYAYVWGVKGALKEIWGTKHDGKLHAQLKSIRDLADNQPSIYKTKDSSDKHKYPEMGFQLLIVGDTLDIGSSRPTVIICPPSVKSCAYGRNLSRLFSQLHTRLSEIGIAISVHLPSNDYCGASPDENNGRPHDFGASIGSGVAAARLGDNISYSDVYMYDMRPQPGLSEQTSSCDLHGVPLFCVSASLHLKGSHRCGTLGGVLRLAPGLHVGVTTYHTMAQDLSVGRNDIYALAHTRHHVDGDGKISVTRDGIFDSEARYVGVTEIFDPDDEEALSYADAENDSLLFKFTDPRVETSNVFQFPNGSVFAVGACLEDYEVPDDSEAFFHGASSGLVVGKVYQTLCSVAIDGVSSTIDAWEMNSICSPGDSGAWVISTRYKVVLGVLFAFSRRNRSCFIIPAPSFFGPIHEIWRSASIPTIKSMFNSLSDDTQDIMRSEAREYRSMLPHPPLRQSRREVAANRESEHDLADGLASSAPNTMSTQSLGRMITIFDSGEDPKPESFLAIADDGDEEIISAPTFSKSSQHERAWASFGRRVEHKSHELEPFSAMGNITRTLVRGASNLSEASPSTKSRFVPQSGSFFRLGRMFCIPMGDPISDLSGDGWLSVSALEIRSRTMIVTGKFHRHCICVPVLTYGGEGVASADLTNMDRRQHAVVHESKRIAMYSDQELGYRSIMRQPFPVTLAPGIQISESSRIRFDTPYTIGYNQKVLDMGTVVKHERSRLQETFRSSLSGDTLKYRFPVLP